MPDETALVPALSFEEKLRQRIREGIGDLMTEEDLKRIVERGTADLLFKRVEIKNDYGHVREVQPSLVESAVEKYVRAGIDKHVETWMKEHADEVGAQIEKALAGGFTEVVLRTIMNFFAGPFSEFRERVEQRLAGLGR